MCKFPPSGIYVKLQTIDLFDILGENKDKVDIEINWIYDEENESAEEAGEDFIEDFEDLDIKLVAK